MIAIFEAEIQEHQSLAEHYRQLVQEQEKLAADLLAIEQEASGGFQIFAGIAQKIQDSKAIAKIKSAFLNLFEGGDGDGGNRPTDPTPDPEPTNPSDDIEEIYTAAVGILEEEEEDDDDDGFDIIALNGETGDCLTTDDLQEEDTEDTGEEQLIYHPDNSAIAWIATDSENGKLTAVIGFTTKGVAASWEKFIEPMAAVELSDRPAFMDGYKYELRCFGLSMAQISRLAQQDLTKKHLIRTEEIGTAKPPESPKHFIAKSVKIGDRVTRLLTPSEVFEVSCHMSDGSFFAKSLLNGVRQLFKIEDVNVLTSLPESAPKYATVLLLGDEWQGEKLQIFAEGEGGYTLRTPKGENCWYKRDVVEICDEEIEAIADATEPTAERIHPVTQRPNRVEPAFGEAPGGMPTEEKPDTHSILGVGDIVQILSDRYPQFHDHVGTVTEITNGMPPIQVKAPRGIKPYHRSELKLISKAFPVPAEEKELVGAGCDFDPAEDF